MAAPARQLELYDPPSSAFREPLHGFRRIARVVKPLCAACHAKPARYGFRDAEGVPAASTLCFECFHMEITRRQEIAARLARMRRVRQGDLPLDEVGQAHLRRRRAQIAARRALGIR